MANHAAQVLAQVKQAIRSPYAWPGGYPLYIVTEDGGVLSIESAKAEFRQIARDTIQRNKSSGWCAAAVDINWEDPDLICDHSGKRIESAYADDEAGES
jgi:hypothetical protein